MRSVLPIIKVNARNSTHPIRTAAPPTGQLHCRGARSCQRAFESQSPETAGLAAAKSGFGLVEGAFLPAPRLVGAASLWLLAVLSFGAVAVAAGITIGDDVSPLELDSRVSAIAVGGPPIAAEAPSLNPASSIAVEASTGTNLPVQTVVLRGQPPSKIGRHLSADQ